MRICKYSFFFSVIEIVENLYLNIILFDVNI